ncbi:hypothetical protein YPPY07_4897, partial [Yersinia pestis PY-07]
MARRTAARRCCP